MKPLKIAVIGTAGIILILLIYLGYNGLFARVTVTEKSLDSFQMVYQKHVGPYKGIGPVMDAIYYDLLNNYSIKTTKGVGVYYDDPREVPSEECRSIGGCILEPGDYPRIEELKQKYDVREYPSGSAVVAEFPFRGKMAIVLGIFKVYPKIGKYMDEKGYGPAPSLEIYDMPVKKIIYAVSVGIEADVFDGFLEPESEPVEEEAVDSAIVKVEEDKD